MALEYGEIQTQEDLTAVATTFRYDIDVNYTLNNLSFNVFARKLTATAATNQQLIDKIEQIRVSTKTSDPESAIDGDDLWDFPKYAFGNTHNYITKLTSTDDLPHAFGMMFPFSPLPHNMRAPFGLAPNQGKQVIIQTNADTAGDFDNYTLDVIAEGVSGTDAATSGHTKFTQDIFTSGSVDSHEDTQVIGKKLLGTYNFMTTSYDDLGANAAHDITGIREQQLLKSSRTDLFWKPFYQWSRRQNSPLTDLAVIAGDVSDIPDILDDGRWFHDFGIEQGGIDISNSAEKYEIRTIAGVASEATRVYGVVLA